jgi:membrane protein implicated in regulation of membrane protease activity
VALLIGGTLAYFFLPFPWFVATVVVLAAFEIVEARLWWWAIKRRPLSGHESLVGDRGVLAAPGRVRIRGTSYPARVVEGQTGDPVVVEAVEGMTLVVRRAPEERW